MSTPEDWHARDAAERAYCRELRAQCIADRSIVPEELRAPDRRGDRIVAALGLRVLTIVAPIPPAAPSSQLRRVIEMPSRDIFSPHFEVGPALHEQKK